MVARAKRTIVIATVGSDFRIVGVLPPVIYGAAYSHSLDVIGGTPTIVITQDGTLPDGITFTDNTDGTCTFAGTGASVGTYPITITCVDASRRKKTVAYTLLAVVYQATGALITEDTSDPLEREGSTDQIIQEDS